MDYPNGWKNCPCGREHKPIETLVYRGKGALERLPEAWKYCGGGKVFLAADPNTFAAAGRRAMELLQRNGAETVSFLFSEPCPKPDEKTAEELFSRFDRDCSVIVGVGSGVINDCCKLLSRETGKKYVLVATAPSMDGFVSATSSLEIGGLKVSKSTRAADVVIGDTEILKNAPERMLLAGLGDMLAKYISICDWRISALVTGEYYCERVAELVRDAVRRCAENGEALLRREDAAVEAVFDGLVLTGAAMNFAGASRPASGVEHYFSHIWDMRALEFGTPCDLHGIQCGLAAGLSARLYRKLAAVTPDPERAEAVCSRFDYGVWSGELRRFLGKAAEPMILLEEKEQKYREDRRRERTEKIVRYWPEILKIVEEEVPGPEKTEGLWEALGGPVSPEEIGLDTKELKTLFPATRDIRDKYVLSRLVFDLGLTEEFAAALTEEVAAGKGKSGNES